MASKRACCSLVVSSAAQAGVCLRPCLGLALSLHFVCLSSDPAEAAAMRDARLHGQNAEAGCMDNRGIHADPRPCPAHTLHLGNMQKINAGPVPSLVHT